MCGIAGLTGLPRGREAIRDDLERMCDALRHRGPDASGYHVEDEMGLGMRRLRIIDLEGGDQPIANEDGSVTVVFNGEIYNYRQLRDRLQRRGHRFVTDSDTEVLVHLYEERGSDLVRELNGMFAFAIWDAGRQRLLLARDRIGIKPLYYWLTGSGLVFASELKGLAALDWFPQRMDRTALASFLSLGYVPDPLAIYLGVRKLQPGHRLIWQRDGQSRVEEYWSPVQQEDPSIDAGAAVEELRRLVDEAVEARMIADVPLGAFLSGGLDSSTIVAHMAAHSSQPIRTFSIGFEEPEFDEADDARVVSEALGTDHTQLIVRPDVEALMERVSLWFDEPFADMSSMPTYLIAELARKHVTVALSGDGGDELFGGYVRYRKAMAHPPSLGRGLRAGLAAVSRSLPHAFPGRYRLLELSRTPAGRYASTVGKPLEVRDGGIARAEIASRISSVDGILADEFRQVEGSYPHQLMSVDLQSYLPGDILTKVDRMSMAVSLEARVPFLDHRVVEFAMRIPARLKIKDVGKWVLRESVKDVLPERVFEKPKRGFGVPLSAWFRDELSHRLNDLLLPESPIGAFVDMPAVQRVIREHQSRRRNHQGQLWRLLVLHIWLKAHSPQTG
jgi:asparagine synthase (glutamine-hydrolysing)